VRVPVTRRSLLDGMAKFGGAGTVYETLAAWEFKSTKTR
jgi:hypothetical protein